jgi:RND superfamily putative drug exporter
LTEEEVMPGLSAWAVRRPVVALVAWFIALIAIVGLGRTIGGDLNDSFDLPDTESTAALTLLSDAGTNTGSLDGGANIVWSPTEQGASAVDPAVLGAVTPVLQKVSALGSVACVTNPVGAAFGKDCPAVQPQPTADQIAKMPPEGQAAMQEAATSFGSGTSPTPRSRSRAMVLTCP